MPVAAATAMPRLDGRRLLVTGASSGIGRAVATLAAEEGASLALLARSRADLETVADDLPGEHVVVPCDVTDDDAVPDAVERAASHLGGLDGVVISAGVVRPAPILETDPADWRATFEVNVFGLLAVTRAAMPYLEQHDPSDLVLVSSMSGRRRGSSEMSVYAASKHAVHCLADGLREECGERGVRVLTVSPGYVDTPIFEHEEHATAHAGAFAGRVHDVGLPPASVAAQVVHALAQPGDVQLLEIAMTSMAQ